MSEHPRRTDPAITEALAHAAELGEVGVQVAAYLHGELLVHDWTGLADRESGAPVTASSLFWPFSTSKAITATALHLQAERGLVDYEETVVSYWPAYGANGKATTTVRDCLTHRAGVPHMPAGVTVEQMAGWQWMVDQIASSTPWFPPGTTSAYHSLTWGWIIGEIVRLTDPEHRPFARFVAEEICVPLAIDDLYFGVPPERLSDVATLYGDDLADAPPSELWAAANPPAVAPCPRVYNDRRLIEAVLPSVGAITSAHSLARHFAMLAGGGILDGKRLLSSERLSSLTKLRDDPYQIDATRGVAPAWIGVGGYQLGGNPPISNPLFGPGANVLGHGGAGGTIAWAEMDSGLAVAICHNRMFESEDPHPFTGLVAAIRALAADV